MLIGHYAPALLLKTQAPRFPLWALFIGVEVLDYLWSGFVLAGLEHVRVSPGINASNALDLYDMPLSHSVVATVGWSLLGFGVVMWLCRRQPEQMKYAVVFGLAVASHFVLDLVVHVRDLPVAGTDSFKLGFGLWNDRVLALVVETALFVGSALVLTLSNGWKQRRGWWVLAGTMTVLCVVSFFTPTPPTAAQMALSGLGLYVLLPIAAWRVEGKLTWGAALRPGVNK